MSRPRKFPETIYVGMSGDNEMMIIPYGTLTEHLEFITTYEIKGITRYNKQSSVIPCLPTPRPSRKKREPAAPPKETAKPPKTAGKASGSLQAASKTEGDSDTAGIPSLPAQTQLVGSRKDIQKLAATTKSLCVNFRLSSWRCACGHEFDKPLEGKKGNLCPKCKSANIEVIEDKK